MPPLATPFADVDALAEVFDRVRRPAANLTTLLAAIPEGAAAPGKLDTALREVRVCRASRV